MEQSRKKELIMEYKNQKPSMGIISYYCIPTSDLFLGGATDTGVRIRSNNAVLSMNFHENLELQQLWNKYGSDNFEIKVERTIAYKDGMHDYKQEIGKILEELLLEKKNSKRLIQSKKIL